MIACCSNYLAGGELKEQKKKKRRRIRTLWTRSVELWEMMSKKMDARSSSSRLCVKRQRNRKRRGGREREAETARRREKRVNK